MKGLTTGFSKQSRARGANVIPFPYSSFPFCVHKATSSSKKRNALVSCRDFSSSVAVLGGCSRAAGQPPRWRMQPAEPAKKQTLVAIGSQLKETMLVSYEWLSKSRRRRLKGTDYGDLWSYARLKKVRRSVETTFIRLLSAGWLPLPGFRLRASSV